MEGRTLKMSGMGQKRSKYGVLPIIKLVKKTMVATGLLRLNPLKEQLITPPATATQRVGTRYF